MLHFGSKTRHLSPSKPRQGTLQPPEPRCSSKKKKKRNLRGFLSVKNYEQKFGDYFLRTLHTQHNTTHSTQQPTCVTQPRTSPSSSSTCRSSARWLRRRRTASASSSTAPRTSTRRCSATSRTRSTGANLRSARSKPTRKKRP